jgi:PAS domain S-box-containing protein
MLTYPPGFDPLARGKQPLFSANASRSESLSGKHGDLCAGRGFAGSNSVLNGRWAAQITLDGIVQSWSRGAEFLYGYREAEIVSQPLARLLQSNDPRKFDGLLHAAIRGEFPQCENAERLHKDGSSIFPAVSRAPIRNEHGDIVGFVETAKTRAPSSIKTFDDGNLKEILEQMPMVLWTTNLHLRVTSCLGAGFPQHEGPQRRDRGKVGIRIFEMPGSAHNAYPTALRGAARRLVAIRVQAKSSRAGITPGTAAV